MVLSHQIWRTVQIIKLTTHLHTGCNAIQKTHTTEYIRMYYNDLRLIFRIGRHIGADN